MFKDSRLNSFSFMEQLRANDTQISQDAIEANTPTETNIPRMESSNTTGKAKLALGHMVVLIVFVGIAACIVGHVTGDSLF